MFQNNADVATNAGEKTPANVPKKPLDELTPRGYKLATAK